MGDIYGESSDLNNPNYTFRHGVQSQDMPVMLKASGLYELPYGISVSGSGIYSRGFPEKQTVSVGRDTVTLTQITQVLVVAPAGTTSLPSVTLFDLSLKKSFRSASGLKVEPVLSLFNLGNVNTVVNRSTQLGPTYERATEIVRGRLIKFALNVSF